MEDVGEHDEGDDEEWGGVCWDEEEGEPAIRFLPLVLSMERRGVKGRGDTF